VGLGGAVAVAVAVPVAVAEGAAVLVDVRVCVAVRVGAGVAVAVSDGVAVADGRACTMGATGGAAPGLTARTPHPTTIALMQQNSSTRRRGALIQPRVYHIVARLPRRRVR